MKLNTPGERDGVFELIEELAPGHPRHPHVGKNEIEVSGFADGQRLLAAAGRINKVAAAPQDQRDGLANSRFVINDKYFQATFRKLQREGVGFAKATSSSSTRTCSDSRI